ncbi:hypothetical protein GCM10010420_25580 [Streptomyces glaucosporus]|uniref:Uncharacterized protein n=1 Tax=Streptomyces glaucosporus TaxID=284044 RepID=A0ABP5VE96_9ACTN
MPHRADCHRLITGAGARGARSDRPRTEPARGPGRAPSVAGRTGRGRPGGNSFWSIAGDRVMFFLSPGGTDRKAGNRKAITRAKASQEVEFWWGMV